MWIRQLPYSGDLRDSSSLAQTLAEGGLSPDGCKGRAALFAQAAAALKLPEHAPADMQPHAFFVPGRIDGLGKHSDYAGGGSMVVAVERGFSLVAAATNDCRVTITDVLRPETVAFDFDAASSPCAGHWANYPMTVVRRIARNFAGPLRGANVAFASDLPQAAGMSSSSGLVVAVFLALAEITSWPPRVEYRQNIRSVIDLASYLAAVENGQPFGSLKGDQGVGTLGGCEDHTAILTCRPGHVSQYAYCPVRADGEIALPADCVFAVGTSGIAAEKTGAALVKYNATSQRAARLTQLWREATQFSDPHLAAILPRGPAAVDYLRSIVRDKASADAPGLLSRLEHFITENLEILPAARETLEKGDLDRLRRPRGSVAAGRRGTVRQPDSRDVVPGRHRPVARGGGGLGVRRRLWRERLGLGPRGRGGGVSRRLGRFLPRPIPRARLRVILLPHRRRPGSDADSPIGRGVGSVKVASGRSPNRGLTSSIQELSGTGSLTYAGSHTASSSSNARKPACTK